jgi:hypothetical protein
MTTFTYTFTPVDVRVVVELVVELVVERVELVEPTVVLVTVLVVRMP